MVSRDDPDLAHHSGFALVTGFFDQRGLAMTDIDVRHAVDGMIAGAHFYMAARQSPEDARVYVGAALAQCLEAPVVAIGGGR